MEPERIPLLKVFDTPFLSLDGTSVEMAALLFLFLAVLAVANIERGRQVARRLVQAASLLVFFYIVYSCLGVFGMIRNSLHGLTLIGSVYTESFYWLALPMVALSVAVISGPVFCGWICPTGTLQDLAVAVRRRLPFLEAPKATRPRLLALGLIAAAFLALLVWLALEKRMFLEDSSLHWAAGLLMLCYLVTIGVVDDRPARALRLVSVGAILLTVVTRQLITSPTHFAFTSRADPASALATVVIVVASVLVPRAFCRYLCPWGFVMGLVHGSSRLKIACDLSKCDRCNVCTKGCPVAAVTTGEVRPDRCQFCLTCVDRCPTRALSVVDVWQERARAGEKKCGQP